jgi:hypothetical protein
MTKMAKAADFLLFCCVNGHLLSSLLQVQGGGWDMVQVDLGGDHAEGLVEVS